jgi:hypothetical protein
VQLWGRVVVKGLWARSEREFECKHFVRGCHELILWRWRQGTAFRVSLVILFYNGRRGQ